MTRKAHTHLHRTPWWRAYTVHSPEGRFLGNVYPSSVRVHESWPTSRREGWVAISADLTLLADGLESRERAVEFVTEQ